MEDCIFCKIVAGEIPSKKVYEDDECVAFWDIQPQAKVHILVIPKKHLTSLAQADQQESDLLGHLVLVCGQVAREQGLGEDGYRVTTNIGDHGQQSVKHLHFHVLGGEKLSAKMG